MNAFKKLSTIVGWMVFAIAVVTHYLVAKDLKGIWKSSEFIAGTNKVEVVPPSSNPLFAPNGQVLHYISELLSNHPEDVIFLINILSGLSSALAAMLVCWGTIIIGRLFFVGRDALPDRVKGIALLAAGAIAGLAVAFSSPIWFSAVAGEVYIMSIFFPCLIFWLGVKWYALPNA
ncbi:MAG: DUF2723 domain-containing protein [Bacteroidota bacterium]